MITKILICALAGLPDEGFWWIRQDLCNLTRFDYDPQSQTFDLMGLNDICHLEQTLPQRASDGTRLLLVRHAQTAWNAEAGEERFRGRFDLPLDPTGKAQARAVSDRLQQEPIAAIYASPLLRARFTLQPLAQRLGLAVQTHPGLLDIDYGRLQGLSHSDAARDHPELYLLWRSKPGGVCFPHGEGLHEVQRRLQSLLAELADSYPAQTVALVGHQIVNKVLIATLLGLSLDAIWRIGQQPTAVNVLQYGTGTWRTLCLNDTCHWAASDQRTAGCYGCGATV
jgi:broad specificity phosphatase PhoE